MYQKIYPDMDMVCGDLTENAIHSAVLASRKKGMAISVATQGGYDPSHVAINTNSPNPAFDYLRSAYISLFAQPQYNQNKGLQAEACNPLFLYGRGGGIRTPDPLLPKQAR